MITSLLFAVTVAAQPYYRGVDCSFIPEYRDKKTVFTVNGKPTEPLKALRDAGANLLRLRVWVNPKDGYCDLSHTLVMAQEAKRNRMALLIDFHYSDWWADPGQQNPPAAWKALGDAELEKAVFDHSKEVISALVAQKTPPDMVQVGNEVRPGMLWPLGRIEREEGKPFTRLLKAGIAGTLAGMPTGKRVPIMIHNDAGGDNAGCRWFYGLLQRDSVPYDVIGVSYYPFWHGTLDAVQRNLSDLSERFSKDVMVVETAYAFSLENKDAERNFVGDDKKLLPGYPATPQGQAAFLRELHRRVRAIPRGLGVVYWAPEYVVEKGIQNPYENLALFDFDRNLIVDSARALGGR